MKLAGSGRWLGLGLAAAVGLSGLGGVPARASSLPGHGGAQAAAAKRAAAARAAVLRTAQPPRGHRLVMPLRARPLRFGKAVRRLVGHDLAGEAPAGAVATPLARSEPSLAFDDATGQLVMFGGGAASAAVAPFGLNDTWTWDGVRWREQFPATAPVPVNGFGAAMTYDQARKYVLLMNQGNTYTWDGSNWAKLSPAQSPPVSNGASMVYDAATGVDVLFGGLCLSAADPGCDASTGISTATWTWDGTTWTMHAASGGLAGLVFGSPTAMAYDAANGTVVLDSRSSILNTEGPTRRPTGSCPPWCRTRTDRSR
jgi:hypothetical protein